jgi:phosphoglycolate phosphatase
MIGDTVYDMHLAANARVPALGVDWGYHPAADLVEAGARTVLGEFAELEDALRSLWAGEDAS